MAYETTDQIVAELSDHWYKQSDSNIYKLFDTYNGHLEKISDCGDKVMQWRGIQDAEGTTLDLFGKDINTYRPTKDDPPYRFLIYLKNLLARAQGTIPSIVKITSAALGTDQGIKIWKTGHPRHIGIQLPWDYVSDWPTEKFLLNNLQNMLALGYWLDIIVFKASTHVQGYIGAGTTDRTDYEDHLKSIWWTGWRAHTYNHWYFGADQHMSRSYEQHMSSVWWSPWTNTTASFMYAGSKQVDEEEQFLLAQ